MDFLMMHQRPVKTPWCCKVKALPREGYAFKENKKRAALAEDRQLENSLLSQYFVHEKRANNFPLHLSVPCSFTTLKPTNMKPTIHSKDSNFTAVVSLSVYITFIIPTSSKDRFLIATIAKQSPKYSKFWAGCLGEDCFGFVDSVWAAVRGEDGLAAWTRVFSQYGRCSQPQQPPPAPGTCRAPRTWEGQDTQLWVKLKVSHREATADGSTDIWTKICHNAPATKECEAALTQLEPLKPVIIKL